VSEHKLEIELNELATAFKDLRETIDLIEHIIYKSILKEANNNDGSNTSVDKQS
jgi:hypothetical protein